jgi:hypothetical protein
MHSSIVSLAAGVRHRADEHSAYFSSNTAPFFQTHDPTLFQGLFLLFPSVSGLTAHRFQGNFRLLDMACPQRELPACVCDACTHVTALGETDNDEVWMT